jgi:hypothetical protein
MWLADALGWLGVAMKSLPLDLDGIDHVRTRS